MFRSTIYGDRLRSGYLANLTFPVIRYDLGDDGTLLSGPCDCGSAYVRVADIGGRRDDDLRYGSITVPAITFRHALGTDPHVSEYQVTQTATGADILTVGQPDVETLTGAVVTALHRCGLPNPTVSIRIVDRIPRNQASGKLKRFIAPVAKSEAKDVQKRPTGHRHGLWCASQRRAQRDSAQRRRPWSARDVVR